MATRTPKPSAPAPAAADAPRQPRVRPVPAVSRALAILRLLGRSPEPMGMKAIATELGLVPSTALHILRVLVQEELIKVDAGTKRYSLGTGMLSLARSVMERSDFPSLVQPVLDRLARTWGVSTMGVEITASNRMVVLALSRSQTPFRLHVDVGSRFPALVSATGRLVAAFGGDSWEQLEKKFKAVRWDKPVSLSAWKKQVEDARRTGYSVDRDTYISGITLVGVPLLDAAGKIMYTLVAAGLTDHLPPATVDALVVDLRREAQELAPLLSPPR